MKQLGLGSLGSHLEDCLVSWLEMHFCNKNQHVWGKIPIEGAIHLRSHNIPLSWRSVIYYILVSWIEMHFCKQISICGGNKPDWRSHNIPLKFKTWFVILHEYLYFIQSNVIMMKSLNISNLSNFIKFICRQVAWNYNIESLSTLIQVNEPK